jgi:hypothetical protein
MKCKYCGKKIIKGRQYCGRSCAGRDNGFRLKGEKGAKV